MTTSGPAAAATTTGYHLVNSIRQAERQSIAQLPVGTLMSRAAVAIASCAQQILQGLPAGTTVAAMVGPGNNGADALLALLELDRLGYHTCAFMIDALPLSDPAGDPVRQQWRSSGLSTDDLVRLPGNAPANALILDGLFGIGLSRPLQAVPAQVGAWSHRTDAPVLAIDVPSGLNPDTGDIIGGPRASAIRATHTVTLIADKPGLHTGLGPDLAGRVTVADLDINAGSPDGINISGPWVSARLKRRRQSAHKGHFGTVAAIGGSPGMSGAALLAAQGARAVGAGKIATLAIDRPVFDPGEPQLMAWSIERPADISHYLGQLSAAAIGCGLGTSAGATRLLTSALGSDLPLTLDADALNLVAADARLALLLGRRATMAPTILTPHPLEAARLLDLSVQQIAADRIGCARQLAEQTASVVLLKGAGTVLAVPDGRWGLITAGGPALATGGTGDVLAGMCAGLLSQSHSAWEAAAVAAWLHADAGDRWTLDHPMARGLTCQALVRRIVEAIDHCH